MKPLPVLFVGEDTEERDGVLHCVGFEKPYTGTVLDVDSSGFAEWYPPGARDHGQKSADGRYFEGELIELTRRDVDCAALP